MMWKIEVIFESEYLCNATINRIKAGMAGQFLEVTKTEVNEHGAPVKSASPSAYPETDYPDDEEG